jgi:hypothetical protein
VSCFGIHCIENSPFRYYQRGYKDVQKGEQQQAPMDFYVTCATDEKFVENTMVSVFTSVLKFFKNEFENNGLV